MAEEAAIREYNDELLKYETEAEEGSSPELIKRVNEAVALCKKGLHTTMDRILAIADPANGEGWINEVSPNPCK